MVSVYVPTAVVVPAKVAVASPLSTNVTPEGNAPDSLNAGVGEPVDVTAKVPAEPDVNVVLLALVITGGVDAHATAGGTSGVNMGSTTARASRAPPLALTTITPSHPACPVRRARERRAANTHASAAPSAAPTPISSPLLTPAEVSSVTVWLVLSAARGKVRVAITVRSIAPLTSLSRTFHGPTGSRLSKSTSTFPVRPGSNVVPTVAGNGPALSPPGPSDNHNWPAMSSVRPPELRTVASTSGWPSLVRAAVRLVISKLDGGSPPVPTSR